LPALAAPDVDDDVGITPFRQLLQQHRLSGAEPAGHASAAAAGHREQQIQGALPGAQHRGLRLPGPVRPGLAHRPAHRHPHRDPVDVGQDGAGRVVTRSDDRVDPAADPGR